MKKIILGATLFSFLGVLLFPLTTGAVAVVCIPRYDTTTGQLITNSVCKSGIFSPVVTNPPIQTEQPAPQDPTLPITQPATPPIVITNPVTPTPPVDTTPIVNPPIAQSATPKTPPIITMSGSNPMVIQLGQTYQEPGARAETPYGEQIVNIATTGTVDTNTVGTYNIQYTATDREGNVTTAIRTVNVVVSSVNNQSQNQATITLPAGCITGYAYSTTTGQPCGSSEIILVPAYINGYKTLDLLNYLATLKGRNI